VVKLAAFDFSLPKRLIAERPVKPRDSARLLLVPDQGPFRDCRIRDLAQLLRPGDMLVLNNTRVLPARLWGERARNGHRAQVEILLLKPQFGAPGSPLWQALARPARKLKPGDRLEFAHGLQGRMVGRMDRGEVLIEFDRTGAALRRAIDRAGEMPLPPYILAKRPADAKDRRDYQTVFAAREGAVAAPTAGLHFTPALLAACAARAIRSLFVTLHVGAGTFLSVATDEIERHRLQPEWGEVTAKTATALEQGKAAGGRIVAVGTTVLRLLETAADPEGRIHPFAGETDLFITPGYRFKSASILLSNFHLPRSSLFILVAAFIGLDRARAAYAHAIAAGYRFYSYGDACLLHRASS
jgi:S-adenosylmethionine:tRNA ribosyltransferase-isomerase